MIFARAWKSLYPGCLIHPRGERGDLKTSHDENTYHLKVKPSGVFTFSVRVFFFRDECRYLFRVFLGTGPTLEKCGKHEDTPSMDGLQMVDSLLYSFFQVPTLKNRWRHFVGSDRGRSLYGVSMIMLSECLF